MSDGFFKSPKVKGHGYELNWSNICIHLLVIHFDPNATGQPACKVVGSGFPLSKNRFFHIMALPSRASTCKPATGKAVPPPLGSRYGH